jgi:glucose-1-phosphate thymidylyltransferase
MAGMYIFGPQIWDVLPNLKPSARGEYEITDAIQLLIDKGELVVAGIYEGEWFDTGTLPSFLESSRFLTQGAPTVHPTAKVDAQIGESVVIGENAVVRCKKIENSVVLPNAIVKVDVDVSGCLIGGEVVAGSLTDEIRHGTLK